MSTRFHPIRNGRTNRIPTSMSRVSTLTHDKNRNSHSLSRGFATLHAFERCSAKPTCDVCSFWKHQSTLLGSFTDTSAPGHFGTYIWCQSVPNTSAPIPKCLKTLREGAAGQQQANRTQTCPCGPTCLGPCPAASPHYASCAAFVG